jgi:hypothetical protein
MRTIDLAGWGGLLAGVAALVTSLRSCQTTDAVSQGSEAISNGAAADHVKLEELTKAVADLNGNVSSALIGSDEGVRDNAKAIEELSVQLIQIARTAAPAAPPPVLHARPATSAALPRVSVAVPAPVKTPFPHWNAAQQAIESK